VIREVWTIDYNHLSISNTTLEIVINPIEPSYDYNAHRIGETANLFTSVGCAAV
jgi:hypothetical protein